MCTMSVQCLYNVVHWRCNVVQWLCSVCTMFGQCVCNVCTMCVQCFLQCLYNVCAMFVQWLCNVCAMLVHSLYNVCALLNTNTQIAQYAIDFRCFGYCYGTRFSYRGKGRMVIQNRAKYCFKAFMHTYNTAEAVAFT